MSDHGFSAENLLRTLPEALREDEKMLALSQVIAGALSEERTRIRQVNMYARIMTLPNRLLDILAHDFKVDWWDPNMTVLQKRRVLAASWTVHRTIGTVGAVKTAAAAIYPEAAVSEWFEYGGDPYGFKIDVGAEPGESQTEDVIRRFLDGLAVYKNLRSHLESVRISYEIPGAANAAAYASVRIRAEIYPREEII